MKITKITINNYKAFYGKHSIDVNGKNLFVYGENGSGKSSLYYALKDFFQSADESVNLNAVENLFIEETDKGSAAVEITFNSNERDLKSDTVYSLSKDTNVYNDVNFRDTNSLKSFLTYKHLLEIHHINKGEQVDLFNLLVNGVLANFKRTGASSSFRESWESILELEQRETSSSWKSTHKKRELNASITNFNENFGGLFIAPTLTAPNPDYILEHAQPILDLFEQGVKINLRYQNANYNETKNQVERGKVLLSVSYGGKDIPQPHLFFNEARLSAIAISIYLGMIKRYPQLKAYKILYLDDLFIGLDISNRMPLLEIIDKYFGEYQVFISTYDKPWYEMVKFILQGNANWECIELCARKSQKGFDIPIITSANKTRSSGDHIQKQIDLAKEYYNKGDNKAAGVYIRTAFEFILKRHCYGKIPVKYQVSTSDLDTEDFWNAIQLYHSAKGNNPIKATTKTEIEVYRKFVLNPLNHLDTSKYELSTEIEKAIKAIEELKKELKV